ncbi:MAG: DMT family transporter [Chloroflexi bacterium]|nr:DMT family transporter [Chloroflexota bacterium]
MNKQANAPRAFAVLLLIGSIWGSSFLFMKVLLDDISPIEIVAGRLFFGMLAIGLFVGWRRIRVRVTPLLIVQMSFLAFIGNIIPFGLIAWGEEHIDSGIAGVLNSTMPIFTAILAAIFLAEERITPMRLAGIALGFAGVLALTGVDIVNVTDSSVLGQLAVIGAAFCYGIGAVYTRSLLGSHDPVSLASLQITLAMVLTIPLVFIIEGSPGYGMSAESVLSLLGLGVLGTGLAYVLFYWLIDNIGSVRSSLVTYVVPVIALFLGWLVLDEGIGLNVILGSALIIGGVASVMRGQAPSSVRPTNVREENPSPQNP